MSKNFLRNALILPFCLCAETPDPFTHFAIQQQNQEETFDAPSQFQLIDEQGHQMDCLNCIISSIKQAINDPDCLDDDILLFKHETVFINDMHLIRKAVEKMLEGYDMVARFYMTNVFYLKVSAAREIFKDLETLSQFPSNATFCEDYFTKYIVKRIPRVYTIKYAHWTRCNNQLGFFHIPPPGERNSLRYWDKSNYHGLYS